MLSYPEVYGTTKSTYYLNNGNVGEYEGIQYEYFKTNSNRIKYPNNNGSKGSDSGYWWLRSPSTGGYAVCWLYVYTAYETSYTDGDGNYQLAPAFCL